MPPDERGRPRREGDLDTTTATSEIVAGGRPPSPRPRNLSDYRAELAEWEAAFRALGYPWKMTSNGIKTKCPVHGGKSDNSLSLGRSYQNRVMVHCFGDPGFGGESTCTYRAIKQTIGLWEDRPRQQGGDDDRPLLEPGVCLDLARAWLEMYVVFPSPEAADAFALFAAATHAQDAFDTAPYVWISSADVDSGKSRLASEAGAALVHDPERANQATLAVLFREIEKRRPTIIIDEADRTFSRSREALADLTSLLNDGYRRGGYASRFDKDKKRSERFSVFCPKVIAGLGQQIPDTIKSRSIPIRMEKRLPTDVIARMRTHRPWADYEPGARLRKTLADTFGSPEAQERLRASYPDIPDQVVDRAGDIWEPLLAIAALAGGTWPARARKAAVALSSPGATAAFDKESAGRALLRALRAWFEANPDRTGIGGEEVVRYLISDDVEGDFGDWWGADVHADRLDKPKARLRNMLKAFAVKTHKIRISGDKTARGYRLEDLEPVFSRYLGGTGTPGTGGTPLASTVPPVPPVPPTPHYPEGDGSPAGPDPFDGFDDHFEEDPDAD